MIKRLYLENFKAFGAKAKFDFEKVTLIFGQNSAGKSSILQALNLLKQTRNARDAEALLLPRSENGFVDLGSYKELIFNHDMKNDLSIQLDFSEVARGMGSFKRRLLGDADIFNGTVGLELCFTRKKLEDEISLKRMHLHVGDLNEPLVTFKIRQANSKELHAYRLHSRWMMRERSRRHVRSKYFLGECIYLSSDERIWKNSYDRIMAEDESLLDRLRAFREELLKQQNRNQIRLPLTEDTDPSELLAQAEQAIDFYTSKPSLGDFITRMTEKFQGGVIGLNGFIPFSSSQRNTIEERIFDGTDRLQEFFNPIKVSSFIGHGVDAVIDAVFPMGPYRERPERWYTFSGTSPHDVGYRGQSLPALLYRNSALLEETNQWLTKLEINYELKPRALGERNSDLFELRMVDKRRKKQPEVTLADVGFGISQLLPFVVQSIVGKNQIITIEQPEVHIHPKLQADLGDLLAESVKTRNNQFLIETHSEHLILRLQKLVRHGELRPEDLSVLYISRGEKGSEVKRLRVDEDGDFIDEWPGGFFPERLKELGF